MLLSEKCPFIINHSETIYLCMFPLFSFCSRAASFTSTSIYSGVTPSLYLPVSRNCHTGLTLVSFHATADGLPRSSDVFRWPGLTLKSNQASREFISVCQSNISYSVIRLVSPAAQEMEKMYVVSQSSLEGGGAYAVPEERVI